MIARATGTVNGKESELLLVGLSAENIARMMLNEPITVTEEKHPGALPKGWTMVLMYGESEQEMMRLMKEGGLIGQHTKSRIDPRLT